MGIFQENIKREALAEEIEKYLADNQLSGYPRTLMEKSVTALREPATEAVRDALVKAADTFRDLVGVLQLLNRPVSARACEIAEEGCRAALKGKGASQGADGEFVMVPRAFVEFLCGAEPLDGLWFGDRDPLGRPIYWWRKYLREYVSPNEQKAKP